MAHKKGEGSVKNGRDSQSKRLGVKIFGGQAIFSWMVFSTALTNDNVSGNNCLSAEDLNAKTLTL